MLAGCAQLSNDRRDRVVYENLGNRIIIAPQEAGSPGNDHPIELAPAQISSLLSSLQLTSAMPRGQASLFGANKQEEPRALFTPDTLSKIAEPLSAALSTAGPQEDVILQVRQLRPRSLVKFLSHSRFTTARLFHRNEHLHVIAGVVDADPEDDNWRSTDMPMGGAYRDARAEVSKPFPVGSRKESVKHTGELASTRSADAMAVGRGDWVVLKLDEPSLPIAATEASPAGEPMSSYSNHPVDDAVDPELAKQLQELKQLHDRGLLSDSVYESLVREAIERGRDRETYSR